MDALEVSSDFALSEADVRRFFSFCGEIEAVELRYRPGERLDVYAARVAFRSGAKSALLLDKSTFQGHVMSVRPDPAVAPAGAPGEGERASLLQKVRALPAAVQQGVISVNERYDLGRRVRRFFTAIPDVLMRPCAPRRAGQ